MRASDTSRAERVASLRKRRRRDPFLRGSLAALLLLVAGSGYLVGLDAGEMFTPRRLANLERFLAEMKPYPLQGESWSSWRAVAWWAEQMQRTGWEAARTTFAISVAASLLAGLGGLSLALLAARSLATAEPFAPEPRPAGVLRRGLWATLAYGTRALLLMLRAVPEYLWVFLLLAVFGPSAWPAVLGLAIHNAGVLGRLDAELLEHADTGPAKALRAAGAGRLQIATVALLPALLARLLLFFSYRWETCVREATVLGMLGIASLGFAIQEARVRGQVDVLVFLVAIGIGLVVLGDGLSALTRSRLRHAP